jgi:plasmid stabilization system protein ParE
MSRGRFVVSPQALDDLDEMWVFLASDSVEAADRVETAIRGAIRRLAEFPELGHVRYDLTDLPVKFWPVYSYLIVYNPKSDPLEIVRVLSGALDIPEIL